MSEPFVLDEIGPGDHNILSPRSELEKVLAELLVSGHQALNPQGLFGGSSRSLRERLNERPQGVYFSNANETTSAASVKVPTAKEMYCLH
jgi:hypothetical protein